MDQDLFVGARSLATTAMIRAVLGLYCNIYICLLDLHFLGSCLGLLDSWLGIGVIILKPALVYLEEVFRCLFFFTAFPPFPFLLLLINASLATMNPFGVSCNAIVEASHFASSLDWSSPRPLLTCRPLLKIDDR